MEFIKRVWRGEERLWKVFWLWGWLFPWLFSVVVIIVGQFVLGLETETFSAGLNIAMIPYTIFWAIITWKCAWNTDWKLWGYLARGVVLLLPIIVILAIAGGVLVGMDMVEAAKARKECGEMLHKHAIEKGMTNPEEYVLQQREWMDKCVKSMSGSDGDRKAK